jgi:haloacetate dehalogenase
MRGRTAQAGDLRMHFVEAGDGPAVVLLHGWPQTSYCWRRLIPALSERYRVIAPDLRGYGLTDKPTTGYDKRTMANDVVGLLRALEETRVTLVGHDRGARVAHRLALDHPDVVERVVVMDILPTREMWRRMDASLAVDYWHWLFHRIPDLPERLVAPDVRGYLTFFFDRWTFNRAGLEDEAVDEYVRAFSRPGALRSGFDDYRAADVDALHDEADADAGRRLEMPLLVLWGEMGLHHRLPTLDVWREYCGSVEGRAIARCGHFLPEERPDVVLEEMVRFLG